MRVIINNLTFHQVSERLQHKNLAINGWTYFVCSVGAVLIIIKMASEPLACVGLSLFLARISFLLRWSFWLPSVRPGFCCRFEPLRTRLQETARGYAKRIALYMRAELRINRRIEFMFSFRRSPWKPIAKVDLRCAQHGPRLTLSGGTWRSPIDGVDLQRNSPTTEINKRRRRCFDRGHLSYGLDSS